MATHTRRELLRTGMAVAGAAALPIPVWARETPTASAAPAPAPLPSPQFYWGIGLENGWIPQANPAKDGTRRRLDVFEQMQHYRKWQEDLQRAADLGVNAIRYSVPWYRAEPKPGQYDWSWIDGPVEHLVTKLKIIPVMDLIHYGTPAWMEDGIADDRFADALTAYTAAMAAHFRGLVNHYTPQHEPQVNALFCAGTGRWPPYGRTPEVWSKVGVKLARALVLQSRSIRQEAPESVLISAESFVFDNFAQAALAASGEKQSDQVRNDVALFPSSLAYGRIDATHPLRAFLLKNGVPDTDLKWFDTNFATPDIHGVDYYPEIEVAAYQGDYTNAAPPPGQPGGQAPAGGQQPLSLEQAARRAAQYLEARLRLAYNYHRAPLYLTETSAGLTAEKKVAYLDALYQAVLNLRADGIPLRGLNWWPLFETIQWEYREQSGQPLESFIRPGGWNNGLYVTQAQSGELVRVHTPAADRFRDIIRRDRTADGLVQAPPRRGNSPEAASIMMARAVNWEPSDAPNTPIGTAQGIFPGRVTWIRDVRVAPWGGKTGRWWEDGNINQPVLNDMFAKSLNALTGRKSNEQAWDALFRHYNAKQGRGNRGWQAGEQIAVKINLNNSSRTDELDNNIDQSTHGLRALLAQLTGPGKVDPAAIVVFDATRVVTDRLYVPLHAEFPAVRWVNRAEAPGREGPQWVDHAITYTSPDVQLGNMLPKCCVDATYLVNMALLKGHEIAGVTLCAKNHFGSIQYPSRDHNKYVPQYSRPLTAWNGFVDLMGSPNLGGKTMLYILDGVYATQTNVRDPVPDRDRWNRLFNGEWSALLLMSQDPVAIDSVGLDFLRAEFRENLGFSGAPAFPKGSIVNCDNYLHEAAQGRNAQLGPYRPNGQEIGSLGVHEHWNNETEKRYSRNLDPKKGKGIELVKVAQG